ncbi:MAG: aspartate/glutamate racemase family protein [Steroidobacteraceae bacterium]
MRTLGLIGGLSWESTLPYYRLINQAVRNRLGGLHSAQLVLYSVDFQPIERHMRAGEWDAAGAALVQAARALQAAGAEGLVLCTNTLHKVSAAIEIAVGIPLLHIIDLTAAEIRRAAFATVGLLGTGFTMEQPFYAERLRTAHGIRALTPAAEDRRIIDRIIFDELCVGRAIDSSRQHCRRIMGTLVTQGAQAIILGCTELALLIQPQDTSVPLFDTTAIHAQAAADWALSD